MLRVRLGRKMLWLLVALIALPALWILEVEVTYERNVRRGIPAEFLEHRQHKVVLWRA
jgi:hypothetical protein